MADELSDKQKRILEAVEKAQEDFNEDLFESLDLSSKLSKNFSTVLRNVQQMDSLIKDLNERIADMTDEQKEQLRNTENEVSSIKKQIGFYTTGTMALNGFIKAGNSLLSLGGDYGNMLSQSISSTSAGVNTIVKGIFALKDNMFGFVAIMKGLGDIIVTLTKMGFERFKELESAAQAFREETGLIVTQTALLDKYALSLNQNFAQLGLNIKEVRKAQAALVKEFGSTLYITDEIQETVARMSTQLGVSAEDTSRLFMLFGGMTKFSEETNKNLIASVALLAEAGGVAPREVFKDIANASADTLNIFSGMPRRLAIAAVEARRMGTTLESMTKSARGLLNFQDSINAEMELSALLGRNVNLQLSRELAFMGEIEKSREAALDQLGTIDDFNRMTIFEKEAAAKAVGMETAEIIKQLGIREQQAAFEKQISKDLNSGNAELIANARKRQDLQKEYNRRLKETNDLNKKGSAEEYETMMQRNLLQNEFNKLSSNLEKIWNRITKPFSDIAELVLPKLNELLKDFANSSTIVFGSVLTLSALFATAVIATLTGVSMYLGKTIGNILGKADVLQKLLEKIKTGGAAGGTSVPTGAPSAPTPSIPSAGGGIPSGRDTRRYLADLSKGLVDMGKPGVRQGAINLKIVTPALAGLRVGALGLKALERIDMVKVKKSLDDLADSISKFGTGKVTGGAFNMILAAPALLAIGLASLALWPLSKMSGAGMANGLSGIARGIERFGTFGVTRAIGNIALMGLATAGIIVAVGKSLTYASEGLKAMSDVDAEKAGKSAAVMASIVGGLYLLGQTGLAGLKGIGIGLLILGGAALGISAFAGALVLLGEGLNSVGPGLVLLGKGLGEILMPIVTLAAVSPLIGLAAISIGLLSGALVALASAQVLSSLLGFFSKDPFEKIIELSTKAKDIKTVSTAMSSLATSMKSFRSSDFSGLKDSTNIISDTVKAFINLFTKDPFERLLKAADKASQITQVANAVSSLEKSIRGFNDINFDGFKNATGLISDISTKITDKVKLELETTAKVVLEIKNLDEVKDTIEKITQAVSQLGELMAQQKPTIEVKTERMEQKLDELIGLMKDGAITAKVSTKELSSAMSTGGR